MPRKKLELICPYCDKTFSQRSKFNVHTGLNKRSKLPNCKVQRALHLEKIKDNKQSKERKQVETFYLQKGSVKVRKNILKDKWFNYLYNRFGLSHSHYEDFMVLKEQVAKKLEKDKNYYRWYQMTEENGIPLKNIDRTQGHEYVSHDIVFLDKLENKNYYGEGMLRRHKIRDIFERLFFDWGKTNREAILSIKNFKEELAKESWFLSPQESQCWAPVTQEERVCWTCDEEYDERDDWMLKIQERHPDICKSDDWDEKFWQLGNCICKKCRIEQGAQPFDHTIFKYNLWGGEYGLNTCKVENEKLSSASI